MQALEFIKDLFKHKDSLGLHFDHKWLTHFGCVKGFSGLFHTFFGWGFISKHDAYRWSSSLGKRTGCIGHFVFMCCSSTFLSHLDNTSFLFLFISFGKFWPKKMQVCGDIMGPRSQESIQGSLMGHQTQPPISFGGIGLLWCTPNSLKDSNMNPKQKIMEE